MDAEIVARVIMIATIPALLLGIARLIAMAIEKRIPEGKMKHELYRRS